jgi:membrane protein
MGTGQLGFYLERRGPLHLIWLTFRRALISAYENNCLGIAKGAAYSALLSFFPVLTTVTALLIEANADSVSKILSSFIFEIVPPGTEEIVRYNFTERGQRPVYLLVIATLLSLWAGSGFIITLMQGFQAAYRVAQSRSFLRQRALAIALVFFAVLPIITASALLVFGARTEKIAITSIGLLPEGGQLNGWISLASQTVRYLLALGALLLGTSILYYYGPNHPGRQFRNVWPGGLVAIALWWITTAAFGWYVRNIANYNVLYGSIGAVVALLVWMYLLSIIALLGCEYNAERERLKAGGIEV